MYLVLIDCNIVETITLYKSSSRNLKALKLQLLALVKQKSKQVNMHFAESYTHLSSFSYFETILSKKTDFLNRVKALIAFSQISEFSYY